LPNSRSRGGPPKATAPAPRSAAASGRREAPVSKSDRVDFAHESERQFAQLLDFYQIEWEYEPRSFDVEWETDGSVSKRFTPDFYLPHYDLYIEITTLNQKLVTKKNRKVRRLRELYPGVNIKIFYQRDYLRLLEKYGLAEPPDGAAPERAGKSSKMS
jgi:hypoxanthine phosphoribosyltransferase